MIVFMTVLKKQRKMMNNYKYKINDHVYTNNEENYGYVYALSYDIFSKKNKYLIKTEEKEEWFFEDEIFYNRVNE